MKRVFLSIGCLSAFSLIVVLPPLIHGYVYPNIGHDTAAHLEILDQIKIGSAAWDDPEIRGVRYYADYIIGYPIDLLSTMFDASKDSLFFWFHYLALIGVGFTLFYVLTKLVNLTIGLLALLIPIFSSFGFLALFYSGVIFNVINMGIILPWIIYCLIKSAKNKKYIIPLVFLSGLFMVFHSTGIYLPFFALAGICSYVVYKLVKKERINRKLIVFVSAILIAGSVLLVLLNPISIDGILNLERQGLVGVPLLVKSLTLYMSAALMLSLVVAGMIIYSNWKQITNQEKLVASSFLLCALVMLPAIFGLSPMPFVQGIDFAILLSIVITVLIGVSLRIGKDRTMSFLLIVIVLAGAVPNLIGMFRYNSAVEKVDLQVIEYVNLLDGDSYSPSNNIDFAIYNRFIQKKYQQQDGDVVITRNISMKSNGVLPEDDPRLIQDRQLLKVFTQGEIQIEVYK